MLNLTGVCTNYGKIPMLRDLTMEVRQGEVVCLLGANGAGKSTVLKTIIGLVKPVSGSIVFKGDTISTLPTYRIVQKGISLVPEDGGMFPRMTVETNLQFGAYFQKDEEVIAARLDFLHQLFPWLKQRLHQKAGTLSGGERCMLSIARGLLAGPSLLLMDEPSLGLAPVLVDEIFRVIAQIKREKGLTLLLVEQNAKKALSVADRGYVLQKGRIVSAGSREELLDSDIVRQSYLHVPKAKSG